MTTEQKLKNLILSKYRSVREFANQTNMPCSTVTSIFAKGIDKTSITTMIKICNKLEISLDELIDGRITFVNEHPEPTKVEDIIFQTKHILMNTEHLTLNGQPFDDAAIKRLSTYLDAIVDAEKKNVN